MASDQSLRIKHRASMATDVGMIREHNEDAAHVDAAGDFFIVADGMGGHAAGEVASAMAVEAVRIALDKSRAEIEAFAAGPSDQGRKALVAALENAVRQAHQSVFERGAREADKQGMGTTLDVLLVAGAEGFVAHVGDSRTYLVRDGKASQITTDHTVAEVLVIEGKLSIEEAQISPLRTILVNAIGVAPDVGVEMAHVKLKRGDVLLLCSDGLHDYFPMEQEIASAVTEQSPAEGLEKMVSTAKNRGGHDNITGIVLEVLEAPLTEDDELGSADTGDVILPTDGVPSEVAREDTMPVEDKQAARPASSRAKTEPPEGEAPDADGDLTTTAPMKPLGGKKKKGKKKLVVKAEAATRATTEELEPGEKPPR